ncbi:hypothetical protein D9M69_724060 [compost metagenome]
MVSSVMRYSLPAKNRPTRIRQVPAPNGSSTTPLRPPSMNLAGMPSTVSEPNQVAKVVVMIMNSGRCRPAIAKSVVFFTRLAAYRPMAMVTSR